MGDYKLVMINEDKTFHVHIISTDNYEELMSSSQGEVIVTLMEDTKSRCSFLYKALLSSDAVIQDNNTGKKYKTTLQNAISKMNTVNLDNKRISIVKLDLSVFASMWSRLTAHFPDFSKSNELIVNAENSNYFVYPDKEPTQTIVIETDNPESNQSFLDLRSISSDGLITDIKLLSEKSKQTWQVQYEIEDASITCIKTETVDREKLTTGITQATARKYKYEFMSSIEEAVIHIISEKFEPRWY